MLCAIPMEIVNRELDYVLYLALHLAKRGMPTLLGERMVNEYVFRLNKGMPVLYFDQDQNVSCNQKVLDAGGVVFNLSSEGQNIGVIDELASIFSQVAGCVDMLFTRGEVQSECLREAFPRDRRDRVQPTGHPSFDLLGKDFVSLYEDQSIIDTYGDDCILINTNFVNFNHKMGFDNYVKMMARMEEWACYTDPEFLEGERRQAQYEERVAGRFVSLARELAARFPDRHIVLRPHPMEGVDYYCSQLEGVNNVHVTCAGEVRRWLASAGAVIHHDCTTGVEALFMEKLVIRYNPFPKEVLRHLMQTEAGLEALTVEEVVQSITNGAMDNDVKQSQFEALQPFVANFAGNATEKIAEYALSFSEGRESWVPQPLGLWESVKCWRKYVSKLIRARQPGHNGRKVRYALNKFPRTPLTVIKERLELLRNADPELPPVQVEELALNTYLMKPSRD